MTPGRKKAASEKEFIKLVTPPSPTVNSELHSMRPAPEEHDLPFSQMLPAAGET